MLSVNPSAAEVSAFGSPAGERRFTGAAAGPAPGARAPLAGSADLALCPHRCARWALGEGLGAGDTVALLMRDSIRAAPLRLGLDRVGIRVVALDAGRRDAALAASLAAARAALLIADTALAAAYAGVLGRLETYPALWWNGPGADFARLDLALAEQDGSPLRAEEIRVLRRSEPEEIRA